uniref:Uncharacterized protein n=1 Tax=Meloidogyne javanica TaxID=6303 RepID=A0A915LI19_MELJA
MSKSFNILLLLLSILILLPKASGGGPGGRCGRRAHRGGRSGPSSSSSAGSGVGESGAGASTAGNLQRSPGTSNSSRVRNIGASSSTGDGTSIIELIERKNVLEKLIRDYSSKSVADYNKYFDCLTDMEILDQQTHPAISNKV